MSPSAKRTVVLVCLKSWPARAVPECVVSVTLALPRDPPVRETRTIGDASDSFAEKPASLNRRTPAWRGRPPGQRAARSALRRGSLKRGLPRGLRPRVVSSSGPRFCGSWMNDCAADSPPRSSTASASRLTCTANSSPRRSAAERDLDALGGLDGHHAGRARAAVVGVAVDVELVLSPQRLRGVRRRRRTGPPRVLMPFQIRDAAGVEEVAARRRGVRARVEAHDGAHRVAGAGRRALPRGEAVVVVDRLQQQIRQRDLQRGVAVALLVGLVLVEVREPALRRAHPEGIGRRRLSHHGVLRALVVGEQRAERVVARQEVPVRRVQREVEHHPAEIGRLLQLAPDLRPTVHRHLAHALVDPAHLPEPHRVLRGSRGCGEEQQSAEREDDRPEGDAHGDLRAWVDTTRNAQKRKLFRLGPPPQCGIVRSGESSRPDEWRSHDTQRRRRGAVARRRRGARRLGRGDARAAGDPAGLRGRGGGGRVGADRVQPRARARGGAGGPRVRARGSGRGDRRRPRSGSRPRRPCARWRRRWAC